MLGCLVFLSISIAALLPTGFRESVQMQIGSSHVSAGWLWIFLPLWFLLLVGFLIMNLSYLLRRANERICLTDDRIMHRSIYRVTREILYSEVKSAKMSHGAIDRIFVIETSNSRLVVHETLDGFEDFVWVVEGHAKRQDRASGGPPARSNPE